MFYATTARQFKKNNGDDDTLSDVTRIFLVDDDQDIVFSIKTALEAATEGFTVNSFTSPTIALENFREGYYDLLLLDIRMPEMTGFDLYEAIHEMDKRVPVIFITAFEVYYEALKEMFPNLVPTSFIQKPIPNSELIKRIKQVLKR